MRGGKKPFRAPDGPWLEQRIQLARGQWRREERGGAVRSAGWWESVTVTLSPAAMPSRPPSFLHRALAIASDAIVPSLGELVTAGARRLLDRRHSTQRVLPSYRRQPPAAARALPRSDNAR